MWLEQMRQRCPTCHLAGPGRLVGYRWIITTRGYASVNKSSCDMVLGTVFNLTEEDERSLDRYEGVDRGNYRKLILDVEMDSGTHKCLVYVDPVTTEGIPKEEYVHRINKGIVDAELPPEYIERSIRKYVPAGM
ncbi:MAG TPA: gamma-glutamylcyclotransferase [Desulfuromonadales bacterium]|nr:gamma-glutamylcyclotransferase [Desulfuromonadales bacterium]